MKKPFAISLTCHLLLVVFMVTFGSTGHGSGGNGGEKGGNAGGGIAQGSDKKGEIIDKPSVEVKIVDTPPEPEKKKSNLFIKKRKEKRAKVQREDCPKFFGGVGITWNPQTGQVLTVHRGYPAEAAGFQVGDVLTGASEPIEGEVGTPITIYLERDGTPMVADLTRAKICLDGP